MITVNKILKIQGGQPPYTYSINLNGQSTTNSPTQELAEFTLMFNSDEDLTANLVGFDANGCVFTYNLTETDICSDFVVTPIQQTGNTYSVEAFSPGCEVTYTWIKPNAFNAIQNENQITLTQTRNTSNNQLKVIATNCNGCTREQITTIQTCNISAGNVVGEYIATDLGFVAEIVLNVTSNCEDINWNTLEVLGDAFIQIENLNNGTIRLTTPNVSNTSLNYSVRTTNGILSNTARIDVTYNQQELLVLNNKTITIPPGTTSFNVVLDSSFYNGPIDLDNVFIVGPIFTPTTYNASTRTFVVTNIDSSNTIITWQALDLNGVMSQPATLVLRRLSQNITFNSTLSSLGCNTAAYVQDLTQTEGAINFIRSLTPQATVNGTTVTVPRGISAQFEITNSFGQTGIKNVYVCDECSGPMINISTCEQTVNMNTFITDPEFIEWTNWPMSMDNPNLGPITFPFNGTYSFEYSTPGSDFGEGLNCQNKTRTVLITKQEASPVINDTRNNPNAIGANVNNTFPFSNALNDNFISNCSNLVTASEQNFSTNILYDKWYSFGILPLPTANDYRITFRVNSIGLSNPLVMPKLKIFKGSPIGGYQDIGTVNFTSNNTAVFERIINQTNQISDIAGDYILQVAGNNQGNFIISVEIVQL